MPSGHSTHVSAVASDVYPGAHSAHESLDAADIRTIIEGGNLPARTLESETGAPQSESPFEDDEEANEPALLTPEPEKA